jgi:hypothetical protein
MKIENYYLDLNKLHKLEEKEERDQIHSYYKDMLYSIQDGRKEMGISIMKKRKEWIWYQIWIYLNSTVY